MSKRILSASQVSAVSGVVQMTGTSTSPPMKCGTNMGSLGMANPLQKNFGLAEVSTNAPPRRLLLPRPPRFSSLHTISTVSRCFDSCRIAPAVNLLSGGS